MFKGSPDDGEHLVRFGYCGLNMGVKGELVVNVYSKVFFCIRLKDGGMGGVVCHVVLLPGVVGAKVHDMDLCGVESQLPLGCMLEISVVHYIAALNVM